MEQAIQRTYNPITGEIYNEEKGLFLTDAELQRAQQEKERRKNYFEFTQQKQILHIEIENILGQFYFSHYKRLLKIIQNDTALAFRYLYICTYADNDGRLIYKGKQMLHKDVVKLLNINRNTALSNVNKMIEYGLLIEEKGLYSANLQYYIRRKKLPEDFKKQSSRIFDNGIRTLYCESTARHHEILGEIVPLLEYINKYNNVVCTKETVEQREFDKINPLTMKEICSICGRSIDNTDVFKKQLGKYKINGLPLFRGIIEDKKSIGYVFNPYILYMGSRNDDLEFAFNLFDLKRKGKLK